MPIRIYKCPICGKCTEELFYGTYPKTIKCECGAKAKNKFGAPGAIWVNWRPGYDVGLNRSFGTKGERDDYLAARGLSEDKSESGHESSSVPENQRQKMAYLADKEAKLKRDV